MVGQLFCFLVVLLSLVDAAHVYWAEWSATPITQNGVPAYTGTITITRPNGQTVNVGVTFSSTGGVAFVQDGSATETDYWRSGSANSPYTSSAVDNDPPPASVVAFEKKTNVTVEFSEALGNVYLAYNSINGNTYTFDKDFTILSNGKGYWGSGTVVKNVVGSTYQLQATGGDPTGTIGFNGTFSTFKFNVAVDENWNGFTLGTYGLDADVNPSTCIDYLSLTSSLSCSGCSIPTLHCAKLLNVVPQTPQSASTCTKQNEGTITFSLCKAGQIVVLSADANATKSAAFDDLGILTVTAPSGTVRGSNYIAWQNDCQNTSYPAVTIPHNPSTPAVDITSLFGKEVGTFSIDVKLWNKYTPYSNSDVYVCTGSSLSSNVPSLTEATILDAVGGSQAGSQAANGLSTPMTILVAVLSAAGTSLLVVGLALIAGYTIVKNGQINSGLSQ